MPRKEQLLARRQQLLDSLPSLEDVLRGSFFVRERRCGKPSCRCARGKGHRTAYVSVTFKDGTSQQIALTRGLEPVARAWVRNYERWWDTLERVSRINRELLKQRWVDPEQPRKKG